MDTFEEELRYLLGDKAFEAIRKQTPPPSE
jgi:hypothetical protein